MAVTTYLRPVSAVAVRHPEIEGYMIALDPAELYPSDDVLVKAYPWAFATNDQIGSALAEKASRKSVKIPDPADA